MPQGRWQRNSSRTSASSHRTKIRLNLQHQGQSHNPAYMNITLTLSAILLAYIAGSIPSAVWAGKLFHGIDVREHGSGNAGATNTVRVLGWKTGIPVLVFDLFKGWLAAMLPLFMKAADAGTEQMMALQIACGMAAILGHVFPLLCRVHWRRVAPPLACCLPLHPWLTHLCRHLPGCTVYKRLRSLGSMTAAVMFPVLLMTEL